MTANPLRIVVAIATAGRREQMPLTLDRIAAMDRRPDRVCICPARADDFTADVSRWSLPIEVIDCKRPGLTAQRNQILDCCDAADVVVFLDDDYYPSPWYLERVEEIFLAHRQVVVATGHPVHDGATGPGFPPEEADRLLAGYARPSGPACIAPTYGGYGCNMAIRLRPVYENRLRFDERLPLYGWLEDIDFTRRLARFGEIVSSPQLTGVHLAVKKGRSPGIRLGYSQLANPIYMVQGGSISFKYACRHIWRNCVSNLVKSLAPEPWVDRRGRLRGNLLALSDLLRRRLDPMRVLELR
ncbi:glycosyltransferase family 2 protein [Derxia gummosa]|uniref:Glycosyltransferase family 2 protein n=1 Tax=Derxia gummosa DSM 723 TaxID=1121388 RepID=A0A8B6XAE5_9BURK|nr:glycosyltransferase family A protein [Derxia gummosa]